MKTWKQGVIGKLTFPDLGFVYVKCLKYPLGSFYSMYDVAGKTWGKPLFKAFIDLDVLRLIERVDFESLTREEKALGNQFEMHYLPGTAEISEIVETQNGRALEYVEIEKGGLCGMADLRKKYDKAILTRQ